MVKALGRFLYVLTILAIMLSQVGIRPVIAADTVFIVNSTADTADSSLGDGVCETSMLGECTLRAAMQQANSHVGMDTVTFDITGTIFLTEDLPAIAEDIIIDGGNPELVVISGANKYGVMYVNSDKSLTIRNITITDGAGFYCGGSYCGGAIQNNGGTLTVMNSKFSGNSTGSGGAIYNTGELNISDSSFSGNSASGGGGIFNGGTLNLINSTFSGNSASRGGGVYNVEGGFAEINDSTFNLNTADEFGGGVGNFYGEMTLTRSTISSNTSPTGGGIYNQGGPLTIVNSTIAENFGTGINSDNILSIINTTISSNTSNGIQQAETLNIANSILANNAGDCVNNGTINALGENIVADGSCDIPGALAVDPQLGPLADNGGATQTMELLGNSPAIDAADDAICEAEPVNGIDQRGIARPQGVSCDIGAFEAGSNIFVVTNTNDSGPGSLRQAILNANATPNIGAQADAIWFDIPSEGGVSTIRPQSALPDIDDAVIIVGTTQPGASCDVWPPTLKIEIDGSQVGPGVSGLTLTSGGSGSTISGLVINRFGARDAPNESGIKLDGSNNNRIQCNFIGTSADGLTDLGNDDGIAIFNGSSNNLIGGVVSGSQRNLISGNDGHGVDIAFSSPANNNVLANWIGVNIALEPNLGNSGNGIVNNYGAVNTLIVQNLIVSNQETGITIANSASKITIFNNSIYSNGKLGIDINDDGPSSNDIGDGDTGPNNLQNYPVLTSAVIDTSGNLVINYSVDSLPGNSTYPIAIEFFKADSAASGEGQTLLGGIFEASLNAPGSGSVNLGNAAELGVSLGDPIVATALDNNGYSNSNTSEFSPVVSVTASPTTVFTVTKTADTNDGTCDADCSLREAITAANNHPNGTASDEIHFDIPTEGGVSTISPLSQLPSITDPVVIDGYTQPGAAPNTQINGSNAALRIQLSAVNTPGSNGLLLQSGSAGSIIRGLVINNGFGRGIELNPGSDGSVIQGNYIGTNTTGTTAVPNGYWGLQDSGVYISNVANVKIGGSKPEERNIISGNNGDGIALWNSGVVGTLIEGNYIGVGADGVTPLPNGGSGGDFGILGGGISARNYASNTIIENNTIANNAPYGIVLYSGTNTTVEGNTINGNQDGIFLDGNGHSVVGNIIAENGTAIVVFPSSNQNRVQENEIYNNTDLGIDLGDDGVTLNHKGSIPGPNNFQNYPVLTLATIDGNNLRVNGQLDSDPNTSYSLDFYANTVCDPTFFGEGEIYLGSFDVATDNTGAAYFDNYGAEFSVDGVIEPEGITVTATGPDGTSEFSYCHPVSTPNLNWVQAQPVAINSSTQQYITDVYQEKWFKFPVGPGESVKVTLTSIPGSAISLHFEPRIIYDILIAEEQNTALASAQSSDAAFLPSGSLPSGSLPSGSLPSGSLPSGSLAGYLPSGSLPSGSLPSGSLPSGSLPSGSLPSGSLPSGSLPSGSLPSGSLPSGSLPSGSLPSGSLPSGSLPSGSLPSGSLPSGSLDAYDGAARFSLMGIAMDPNATVQSIARLTYDYQGDLYVRVVTPYNLQAKFTVDVATTGGVCSSLQSVPNNLQVIAGAPLETGITSLILTDSKRLRFTSSAEEVVIALRDLQTLAGRADVNGVVIDLNDAKFERVAWANAQADLPQYAVCPAAKNAVANEIKAVIDQYRAANTSNNATTLEYIVLAGGADVIPFFQVFDAAEKATENQYIPPVAPSSPSEAGLKNNLVQSQDKYGSAITVTQAGHTIALPDLAVGRLVVSAADISATVHAYIAADGVVTPRSALVTGYDFVADGADLVRQELNAGTASTADTLIQFKDQIPWTADQLREKLFSGNNDIIMMTGHFSAGNLEAADVKSLMAASEITGSTADFTNTLILALGCHSGYTIPTSDLLVGASPNPDWAKAFLRKGAAGFVAATGYAYGDTEFPEYGERLFVNLAQNLRIGNGPVPLGQALVAAKRQYLADTVQLSGIDAKTVVEMTLYGLPMMKVNMPGARIVPQPEPTIVDAVDGFEDGPAAGFGLRRASVLLAPQLTPHSITMPNLASEESFVTTMYLSGPAGVVANPFEPIYPKEVDNVSVSGLVLRGVAMRSGIYTDADMFEGKPLVPLTTAPTTENSTAHLSFNTNVFYPTQTWMPNFFDALDGGPTRLVTIPAQYRSSGIGSINGTLRQYDELDLQLFYLPDQWESGSALRAAALSPAPSIVGASARAEGNDVIFNVNAEAGGSAGIQALWVLYTGKPGSPYYGQWQPLDLALDINDPMVWMGTLSLAEGAQAQDILFMVQAVGGAGLTTLATNRGAYYTVTSENADQLPPPVATTLNFVSPPASGVYLEPSAFQLELLADGQPLEGQVITLDLGGQQGFAITDANGRATITITPVINPGVYLAQASFSGNADYLASHAIHPFPINKDTTSLTLAPPASIVEINQPTGIVAALRDSSGNALAGKTVFFVVHNNTHTFARAAIVDQQGEAALDVVSLPIGSYTVDAYFSGTIPIDGQSLELNDDFYESSRAPSVTLTIIDTIPPTITASATKADGSAYAAGTWTNQTVTVHFTCADVGSGVAICPPDQVYPVDGIFTANGTATDHAGNSTSTGFGPIKIDKTAPALSPSVSPNPVYLNGVATVTAGASDGGSGLASLSCGKIDTSTVGLKTVTCTAKDNAGNISTASATYRVIYRFDGFLQPINDTGHSLVCGPYCPISIFKGGSTIPVKFQLKDVNGKLVRAGAAPVWIVPQMGNPTTNFTPGVFGSPVASGFVYDLLGQHYSFNWSTKGAASGYYWRIGVMLDDGQTYFVTLVLR